LGIAYLGGVLEESGIEVEVLNLASTAIKNVNHFPDADLYGITCVTATYSSVMKLSRTLKDQGKRVAVGGIHPSIFPEKTLVDTLCDYVLVGEAEYALRDLALGKLKHGIIDAGIIENLDALPFPARHLFPSNDVVDLTGIHGQELGERATTMITSRGCPYNCSFCTKIPQTEKFRFRSPSNIVEEIEFLIEEYGIDHIRFVDDIFTFQIKRIKNLCELLIAKELDVSWVCITRTDRITDELLKVMKLAGCKEVHLGIETGSQKMLNSMNKIVTVKENLDAIKKIREAGIIVKAYLIYGFPGETLQDIEATKSFILEAQPDKFTLSRFIPLPGSAIYNAINPHAKMSWFYPDIGDIEYLRFKRWLNENVHSQ